MRKIIKNEFTYYLKNYSKLFLSLLLIFSFFLLLMGYDKFELDTIKKEPAILRKELASAPFNNHSYLDFDYIIKQWDQVYDPSITYEPETQGIIDLMKESYDIYNELGNLYSGYITLHHGGRMNLELTAYRDLIYSNLIKLYEIEEELGNPDLKMIDRFDDLDHLKLESERLNILKESETPDDFNYYTVTLSNYPSKVFEGLMLFVILIILLLLFYDLISKDFENLTYKNIYTTPIKRNKIIFGKLMFAFLYSVLLITLGIILVSLYLLFVRRIGYNVLSNRLGYILHPQIINLNYTLGFNNIVTYTIVSQLFKNIISIILGISLIIFWILLIVYLSFKLKSSNSNLTILTFLLISIYFVNSFDFKKYFQYVFPIFNFNFELSIIGDNPISVIYIFVLTSIYNIVLFILINRDISKIDLLDGEYDA